MAAARGGVTAGALQLLEPVELKGEEDMPANRNRLPTTVAVVSSAAVGTDFLLCFVAGV
jgi:hypothetical protein